MDWEFGISQCKLLYREWINNKVLLYSTGNCIQYPTINHNEKTKHTYTQCFLHPIDWIIFQNINQACGLLKHSNGFLSQKARLLSVVQRAKSLSTSLPSPSAPRPLLLTTQAWLVPQVPETYYSYCLEPFTLSDLHEAGLVPPFRVQLKYYFLGKLP